MKIGVRRAVSNVSEEYNRIAKEDQDSANHLAVAGCYRQAIYFLVQAMEKVIRAKVFAIVNPELAEFRDTNRSHSLESAIDFLGAVISADNIVREQVTVQIQQHVLGGIRFNHLHNELRYPIFRNERQSYSVLDVGRSDFEAMAKRLAALRKFLGDLHRLS